MSSGREGSEGTAQFSARESLFLLAEELKSPLTTIALDSEMNGNTASRLAAKRALQTLDAIVLGEQVASGQVAMNLQPLHVGSVMVDVSESLRQQLAARQINAQLSLKRGLSLIDTDKRMMSSLLTSLWHIMIAHVDKNSRIACSAKSYKGGVRVSLTSKSAAIAGLGSGKKSLTSTQPFKSIAGSGADILAATNLASLLGLQLTFSKTSIGVTLPKSSQLELV